MQASSPDISRYIYTTQELKNRGLSVPTIRRRAEQKVLVPLRRGVYAHSAQWKEWTKRERAIAHCIAYSRVAQEPVFTHISAAYLHGLDTLSSAEYLHIAQTTRTKSATLGTRLHTYNHDVRQEATLTPHGVLATNLIQTVVDCARSYGALEGTVIADSALRGSADIADVSAALEAVEGYGRQRALAVARSMSSHSESAGESITRFRIREMGFPMPLEQVNIPTPYGVYRPDFVWWDLKIIVEFDGRGKYYNYGSTAEALVRERDREKALTNAGWTIVRVNWESVYLYPERLERDLRRAFAVAQR